MQRFGCELAQIKPRSLSRLHLQAQHAEDSLAVSACTAAAAAMLRATPKL